MIGSDHAGYALKSLLADKLTAWGHNVEDVGAHSTASVDYPEYGRAVG
ncbi:MAG TPA: RpiB/LacA/LacB family sugar-phosphate isomerase, partial [Polyangia bacterium]|nr:RpiB/LacA/LacB family sugar-phosphate isomerase [Polyangia bacterium]